MPNPQLEGLARPPACNQEHLPVVPRSVLQCRKAACGFPVAQKASRRQFQSPEWTGNHILVLFKSSWEVLSVDFMICGNWYQQKVLGWIPHGYQGPNSQLHTSSELSVIPTTLEQWTVVLSSFWVRFGLVSTEPRDSTSSSFNGAERRVCEESTKEQPSSCGACHITWKHSADTRNLQR